MSRKNSSRHASWTKYILPRDQRRVSGRPGSHTDRRYIHPAGGPGRGQTRAGVTHRQTVHTSCRGDQGRVRPEPGSHTDRRYIHPAGGTRDGSDQSRGHIQTDGTSCRGDQGRVRPEPGSHTQTDGTYILPGDQGRVRPEPGSHTQTDGTYILPGDQGRVRPEPGSHTDRRYIHPAGGTRDGSDQSRGHTHRQTVHTSCRGDQRRVSGRPGSQTHTGRLQVDGPPAIAVTPDHTWLREPLINVR